jgi:DNA adenine methylase
MLAPWIIEHFPPHRVYTEAYGGAASVLMRKPRAKLVEVYNDLDGEIVSLFRVLRDPDGAGALARLLDATPFAREEFALSYEPSDDPLEQARRTVVRSFMGFGSDSASGTTTGFRANGNRQSAHPAKDWSNYPAAVQLFCDRLRGVVIESRPAVEVLLQHDAPETLHYCDPTYLPDTRKACMLRTGKGYRHEMTEDDHRQLAEVLHECAGMVVLSGYPSDLYAKLYRDWFTFKREAFADGGSKRVEVLWINDACADALEAARSQHRMFA